MGTSTVVNLFQTGGVILVFICFLVWLVRYFMAQIDRFTLERKELQQQFDTALDNHCHQVTSALVEQRHCFEMLMVKIDELVSAMRGDMRAEISVPHNPAPSPSANHKGGE